MPDQVGPDEQPAEVTPDEAVTTGLPLTTGLVTTSRASTWPA